MKQKILMLVIGILIGAIITSAGFLIFGGNKGKKDFDPSKLKDGDFTPPSFSRDKGDKTEKLDKKDKNSNTVDTNNMPEKTEE